MKWLNRLLSPCVILIELLFATPREGAATSATSSNQTGDPSWPQENTKNGNRRSLRGGGGGGFGGGDRFGGGGGFGGGRFGGSAAAGFRGRR